MSAADFFLKIDEIEGESKDDKLKNQLQLKSWSWGETNSASQPWGGGGGTGKVSMQDFHFVITVGKHSPKLMEACATGKHVGNAVLTCRKAGGEQEDFLIYKFYDLRTAAASFPLINVPSDFQKSNTNTKNKPKKERLPARSKRVTI
jgi:type VI secretion system secreted protein Hcp